MSPHFPPITPPSPWPTMVPHSSFKLNPSPSSSSASSTNTSSSSSTLPLTPRTSSPEPSDKEVSTDPDQPETALSKATQEFAREIAKLEREKDQLQSERDKLAAECDKALLAVKKKKLTEAERQHNEMIELAAKAVVVVLIIPVLFIAGTFFLAQWMVGLRFLRWAVHAVQA